MENSYHLYPLGDHSLTIEFGKTIDEKINDVVLSIFNDLHTFPVEGLRDLIPAYSSLTIVYDLIGLRSKFNATNTVYEGMVGEITQRLQSINFSTNKKQRQLEIPVCYDLSVAPDLPFVAEYHRLTKDKVIEFHCSKLYRVYMIGFLPGFAYMGTVHDEIATPRKSSPRKNVAVGSIGIAGNQTGIYPLSSPGGWQLIGQTPQLMFDASQTQPAFLQAGDEVQFYSISLQDFHQMKNT